MTRKVSKSRPADTGEIIDSINALGDEWAERAAIRLQKAMLYANSIASGVPVSQLDAVWPRLEASDEFKNSTRTAKNVIIECFTVHILKAAAEGQMGVEVVVVDKNKEME